MRAAPRSPSPPSRGWQVVIGELLRSPWHSGGTCVERRGRPLLRLMPPGFCGPGITGVTGPSGQPFLHLSPLGAPLSSKSVSLLSEPLSPLGAPLSSRNIEGSLRGTPGDTIYRQVPARRLRRIRALGGHGAVRDSKSNSSREIMAADLAAFIVNKKNNKAGKSGDKARGGGPARLGGRCPRRVGASLPLRRSATPSPTPWRLA